MKKSILKYSNTHFWQCVIGFSLGFSLLITSVLLNASQSDYQYYTHEIEAVNAFNSDDLENYSFKSNEIKSVSNIAEGKKICLGGYPFGIKLFAKGCVIVDITDVEIYDSAPIDSAGNETNAKVIDKKNPANDAGLKVGDIIEKLNGEKITSNEQLSKRIAELGGDTIKLSIKRGDSSFETRLTPISDGMGNFRAGVWVRDSAAGIGIVTFSALDSKGNVSYAGLGHPICEPTTTQILPLESGEAVPAEVMSVTKSKQGSPGGLNGYFINGKYGEVIKNNQSGIFFKGTEKLQNLEGKGNLQVGREVELVPMKDVKTGECIIVTTIDKEGAKEYSAIIKSVDNTGSSGNKSIVIEITDDKLLEATGGIVQGMSGSPILQNGKLVGAVTHVFVNEPNKGYGIFAEEMLGNL